MVEHLENKGQIIIADGPELNADFDKILSYQPLDEWKAITAQHNITLQIIDLREELYIEDKNVTIKKLKLPGDPKGKVVANLLDDNREFFSHIKSKKGYFGAGSDIKEANRAHDGQQTYTAFRVQWWKLMSLLIFQSSKLIRKAESLVR